MTRRRAVAVGVLAALLMLSGCNGVLGGTGGAPAVDQVPGDVDTVVRVDMAIMNDGATQELFSEAGDSTPGSQPTSVDDAASEFEADTGLDPTQAEEMVVFQRQTTGFGNEYIGIIVHANWGTDEVIEAIRDESSYEYEETTYNGQTILITEDEFAGTSEAVGVLGDGQFALGTREAVEDAMDVAAGDADAFGGDLRAAYDSMRNGLVTFAVTVPDEQIPPGSAGQVDVSEYRNVDTVSGVYYTSGNSVGTELHLHATGADAARDVQDVTDGAISIASGYAQDQATSDTLRSIEVTRNGNTVVISYEESVDTLREILDRYGQTGV